MTNDPFHTAGYDALVFKLRQDLQPDLATDILPYTQAVQPPWRPLTLLNGWTGGAWFYVDTTRRLWLTGRISAGTSGTVAFNLPAGYRPGVDVNIAKPVIDGTFQVLAAVSVDGNGDALIQYGAGFVGVLDLHIAASYRVEQ